MAYEFDPSHVPVVADLLDRVADSAPDLMRSWERLAALEEYQLLDEDLKAEMDFLFVYELQEDLGSAGDVKLVESGLSLTATRPMSQTPASAWQLWSNVAAHLRSLVIQAHIADMLLTGKLQRKPEHAASTIAWYLKASEIVELPAQEVALALGRANTIARSRGMAEELTVRAKMHLRSEAFVANRADGGPALTLLAALSVPPRGGVFEPNERESVRTRLLALGESSSTFIDEIGKTLARLADNVAELEFARRWHVEQYLTLATSADHGMRKMHHAQTAADLASKYGLQDLKDSAVLVMQSVDPDSMGWETVRTEGTMSKNVFRAYLRRYRRARHWGHALSVFLAGPSPSGDHQSNVRSAERAAMGSIRAFITRTVFGTHGLPERTDGDFMNDEIVRAETIMLSTTSILLNLELEYVRDRFSPPKADQIADWMVDKLSADSTLAGQFANALVLHWDAKYSDSARLSIPLVESAARGLLLTLDEPLYRTQQGKSPGRYPALDFYIDPLSDRNLDPDWVRALRVTLLSPGMNLRNLAAHGFQMNFSASQSALLLRLAGLFCAMPIGMGQDMLEAQPVVIRKRLRRRLGWVWV
ncbi:hypothetical protein [Arthrobacter sp. Ld5]|uniref:hypothetical protein n=1 Tax=Arthrobacter sp. Ld5 TaxID=649152 RepID=UPI003EBAB31A